MAFRKSREKRKFFPFFIIAILLLYLGIFSFSDKFVGFFIADYPSLDHKVLESINNEGFADVIVMLDDQNSVLGIIGVRDYIKRQQDSVLSTLTVYNFSDIPIASSYDFRLGNRYVSVNAFSGRLTKSGLDKLKLNRDVKKIYLDRKLKLSLDESAPLIHATNVWAKKLHGINITGEGQTVCIIDTGVDYNHSALGGGWGNKVIAGYRFLDGGKDIQNCSLVPSACFDDEGHGTHVAGIVASEDSVYRGIAPNAKIVIIKACGPSGCLESDIAAGIDWCSSNSELYNISVISMSLGQGTYNESSQCDPYVVANAISKAKANGIISLASSGNDRSDEGIAYPACASNTTSVGASFKSDEITDYSNLSLIHI